VYQVSDDRQLLYCINNKNGNLSVCVCVCVCVFDERCIRTPLMKHQIVYILFFYTHSVLVLVLVLVQQQQQ
jgi:hypothetical protein